MTLNHMMTNQSALLNTAKKETCPMLHNKADDQNITKNHSPKQHRILNVYVVDGRWGIL